MAFYAPGRCCRCTGRRWRRTRRRWLWRRCRSRCSSRWSRRRSPGSLGKEGERERENVEGLQALPSPSSVLTGAADPEPVGAGPGVGAPPGTALRLRVAGPVFVAVADARVVREPAQTAQRSPCSCLHGEKKKCPSANLLDDLEDRHCKNGDPV